MTYQNKELQCSDCGATFTFTGEEQEFYKSKGYVNEPKRCPDCRAARKTDRPASVGGGSSNSSTYGSANRQMYSAVCAQCGKDTQVPFQPRGDRPVYCSDCYRKVRPTR